MDAITISVRLVIEWSQRSNKCPICKTKYNSIFIYDKGIKKQLSLTEIKYNHTTEILDNNDNNNEDVNNENNDDDSDDEGCYICGKNTDQANLLVCDRCQKFIAIIIAITWKKYLRGNGIALIVFKK